MVQVYEGVEVGTSVPLTTALATPIVLVGKYQAEIPDESSPLEYFSRSPQASGEVESQETRLDTLAEVCLISDILGGSLL